MQQATLGKNGSGAASQLQGWIARAFSSNSLMNTMDMTAAIQYILTAAQSLGSQVHYKKSRMTILGLADVSICENEQAYKMDYHMFRREYLLGCLRKLGEVLKQQ